MGRRSDPESLYNSLKNCCARLGKYNAAVASRPAIKDAIVSVPPAAAHASAFARYLFSASTFLCKAFSTRITDACRCRGRAPAGPAPSHAHHSHDGRFPGGERLLRGVPSPGECFMMVGRALGSDEEAVQGRKSTRSVHHRRLLRRRCPGSSRSTTSSGRKLTPPSAVCRTPRHRQGASFSNAALGAQRPVV